MMFLCRNIASYLHFAVSLRYNNLSLYLDKVLLYKGKTCVRSCTASEEEQKAPNEKYKASDVVHTASNEHRKAVDEIQKASSHQQ